MADAGHGTDADSSYPVDPFQRSNDPDAYKDDWYDALVFKKAMKAEAIKRGERYDSEFSVDDEDEHVEMTTTHNPDGCQLGEVDNETKSRSIEPSENSNGEIINYDSGTPETSAQGNQIGFMKKFTSKGGITMYTENEVIYLKTLIKNDGGRWEKKSALSDLYRHCKFTIRKLTR